MPLSPLALALSLIDCGSDSTVAARRGAYLQRILQVESPKATVVWVRDEKICHAAHRADSSSSTHRLFVYSLKRSGVLRYAVFALPPSGVERGASTCFYDKTWRRRGVCLADVQ